MLILSSVNMIVQDAVKYRMLQNFTLNQCCTPAIPKELFILYPSHLGFYLAARQVNLEAKS